MSRTDLDAQWALFEEWHADNTVTVALATSSNGAWMAWQAALAAQAPVIQHDSDCSLHNASIPEMLGPCDCSVLLAARKSVQGEPMQSDAEDAARYRFLCNNAYRMEFDLSASQTEIDAAIDAARKAAKP